MNKKNKNLVIIILILVAAMLFVYVKEKGLTISTLSIPSGCYGHILSIDEVDVDTGEGFTNPYIKVRAIAGQGSDCLLIAWTKEQLNSALRSGDSETRQYQATKDLLDFGYIKLDKYIKKWQIIKDYENAYILKKNYFCQNPLWHSCTISKCEEKLGGNYVYAVSSNSDKHCSGILNDECICISKTPVIRKGRWGDTSIAERYATFAVSNINKEVTIGGSGSGIHSVILKDSTGKQRALIQWTGDLFSGIDVDRPSGFIPIYDGRAGRGNWNFAEKEVWNFIETNFYNSLNALKNCEGDDECIDSFIKSLENSYDDYFIRNEPSYIDEYLRQEQYVKSLVLENPNSLDNAVLKLDLSTNPPTLPTFDIYLDAEWVGIKKAVTQPRIVCRQEGISFKSGMYEDVGITVYNDADIGGQIDADVSCTNGGEAFISPTKYQIGPKSSMTGIVRITATALESEDNYGECTITVFDHTNPSIKDSCTIEFQAKAIKCTEGDKICSSDLTKILVCRDGRYVTEKNCEFGCYFEGSMPKCAESPNPQCPTSCESDADCSPCGEEYACFNNRCMKEAPLMECKSCTSWLLNKLGIKECISKQYLDNWFIKLLPGKIEEEFTQDTLCPFILIFYVIGGGLIVIIIILIIKIIKDISRKQRRRK